MTRARLIDNKSDALPLENNKEARKRRTTWRKNKEEEEEEERGGGVKSVVSAFVSVTLRRRKGKLEEEEKTTKTEKERGREGNRTSLWLMSMCLPFFISLCPNAAQITREEEQSKKAKTWCFISKAYNFIFCKRRGRKQRKKRERHTKTTGACFPISFHRSWHHIFASLQLLGHFLSNSFIIRQIRAQDFLVWCCHHGHPPCPHPSCYPSSFSLFVRSSYFWS